MTTALALAMLAALAAGFVDAVAGGGGLLQLPALLLLFPTTPLPVLLGSNKVSSVAGTLFALARYAGRVAVPWRAVTGAALAAFAGSFGGARLAAHLDPATLRPVVITLLLGMAIYTALRRDFGASSQAVPVSARWIALATLLGGIIGFYDGFFGPGTGTFLIFLFVSGMKLDFLQASASAKLVNVSTNAAAILAFVSAGHIDWHLALPMAACNLTGSFFGTRFALRYGAGFVKRLFFGVLVVLLGKLLWS